MKLDKREISLNETDSLHDACLCQRTLLYAYVDALAHAQRRETVKELLRLLQETGEDFCFTHSLWQSARKQNGIRCEEEE